MTPVGVEAAIPIAAKRSRDGVDARHRLVARLSEYRSVWPV
jgi:hypothetical protein